MRPSQYNYLKRMWTHTPKRRRKKAKGSDGFIEAIMELIFGIIILIIGCSIIVSLAAAAAVVWIVIVIAAFLIFIFVKTVSLIFKLSWPYMKRLFNYVLSKFKQHEEHTDQFDLQTSTIPETLEVLDNVSVQDMTVDSCVSSNSHESNIDSAISNFKKRQEESQKREQKLLEYAMMCQRYMEEKDYLESIGINPDDYEKL